MNALKSNQIHIWRLDLGLAIQSQNLTKMLKLLSEAEIERIKSFHSSDRYHQFIITRAVLRILLARYSGIEPEQVEINSGNNGKPFSPSCYFNLSHSHNLALYAFSLDSEVGIDLEYLEHRNFARLAKRMMNQCEQQAFFWNTPEQQLQLFYAFWTKKEAEIKLQASGIFQQSLIAKTCFNLFDFVPEPGYMAAIAHYQTIASYLYQTFPHSIKLN
jgi:4'-phosphopantetheinyl transferase